MSNLIFLTICTLNKSASLLNHEQNFRPKKSNKKDNIFVMTYLWAVSENF